MSNSGSNQEREFLVTGAKTYLDADDAMAQFRRMVQEQIATFLSGRLDEINQACEMPWTPNDLKDYTSRKSDSFQVGKQLTVNGPGGIYCGGLYCYFRIGRDGDALEYTTIVDLYRVRATLAVELWERGAASGAATRRGNDLWFEQRVPSAEQAPDFLDTLSRTLDDFINFVSGCGGIAKHFSRNE